MPFWMTVRGAWANAGRWKQKASLVRGEELTLTQCFLNTRPHPNKTLHCTSDFLDSRQLFQWVLGRHQDPLCTDEEMGWDRWDRSQRVEGWPCHSAISDRPPLCWKGLPTRTAAWKITTTSQEWPPSRWQVHTANITPREFLFLLAHMATDANESHTCI